VRRLVLAVATVGGVGFLPAAPGTAASLLVVPVVPWLASTRQHMPGTYALVVVMTLAVAVWGAARAERVFGRHDDATVVIDEVAGMVVGTAFIPATWLAAVLLFVAFRIFDIAKPPPIGLLDRRVGGGVGVVADDVLAGLYAGALALIVTRLL
jgi:phosphatidylglycerophosphatase A